MLHLIKNPRCQISQILKIQSLKSVEYFKAGSGIIAQVLRRGVQTCSNIQIYLIFQIYTILAADESFKCCLCDILKWKLPCIKHNACIVPDISYRQSNGDTKGRDMHCPKSSTYSTA